MNGVLNDREVRGGEIEANLLKYIIDKVLNLTSYLRTLEVVMLNFFELDLVKHPEQLVPIELVF